MASHVEPKKPNQKTWMKIEERWTPPPPFSIRWILGKVAFFFKKITHRHKWEYTGFRTHSIILPTKRTCKKCHVSQPVRHSMAPPWPEHE